MLRGRADAGVTSGSRFTRRTRMVGQLDRQAKILEPLNARLADWLDGPTVQLVHVALLPEKLCASLDMGDSLPVPVATWEQVRGAWCSVGGYYHRMLEWALERYDDLASRRAAYQGQRDARPRHPRCSSDRQPRLRVDGTSRRPWRPSAGSDVGTGAWRTTRYQVRKAELPGNPNWFAVASFITTISESSGSGVRPCAWRSPPGASQSPTTDDLAADPAGPAAPLRYSAQASYRLRRTSAHPGVREARSNRREAPSRVR